MKKYVVLLLFILCALVRVHAVGWTPTDAGLVVNLEQGERFLLSVWVDKNGNGKEEPGEEFFVSNYNRYSGGYYNYTAGSFMKLLPATEITEMNEWSVGAPLARGNKALGGIAYTIWNDGKTLKTSDNFKFLGDLTSNYNDTKACDVVFVIPTERGVPTVEKRTVSSFDPEGTLGRGKAPFNGGMGTGFLGMTYREVYMLDIPKANSPQSYTNAALVTFNTTLSTQSWSAGNITKGYAAYAYADSKHDGTPRTIFRLYLLDKPFVSCPNTYFFATDEQDYKAYRKTDNVPPADADMTTKRKIYTMDYLTRMDSIAGTGIRQTGYMNVPVPDSTYYYVGWRDKFYSAPRDATPTSKMGEPGAYSAFKKIRTLPMKDLAGKYAPAGAYGRMVLDSTSKEENHGVAFEPAGYFFKVSTGTNVRMRQINDSTWITQDMWTITEGWAELKIRATLMTGPSFSETDPGADVAGWSVDTVGTEVPVLGGGSVVGKSGYARITTNRTEPNGNLIFIPANLKRKLSYNNNNFLGEVIPDQYPTGDDTFVTVQAPRLKAGYIFDGWTRDAAGTGKKYDYTKGDTIHLVEGTTTLYAQAHYDGTLQIALSFKNPADGNKRYFITHPNSSTPRYARARHFENWDNTWQGMENAENLDPNYISTFELRHPSDEVRAHDTVYKGADTLLYENEKVLDPRQYTMRGYEDSLTFYEFFHPAKDEYLGLYYQTPNTIVANNTWAGLFVSTEGWPTYMMPYIHSTKIWSERYVLEEDPENHPDSLTLKRRSNYTAPYVKYNTAANQFDGTTVDDATEFQLTAIVVADAHYIVLPDTTYAWNDTITFDYHTNTQTTEDVWSALIGKQLMAVMVVDGDTIFFHPNRNKIINDPNELYLSPDFRVTQLFEFIPDARVTSVADEDRATHATTDYYWHHTITSGLNSPINVKDAAGNYTDIFDTLCIHLSHGGVSKIKEYRGRWKKGAPGLEVSADGSERHRDIIIRTKTYHYADTVTKYILTPTEDHYTVNPFANQEEQIDFTLSKVTTCQLKDVDNNFVRTDTVSIEDVTTSLRTAYTNCSLRYDTIFEVVNAKTYEQHVTVKTKKQNGDVGDRLDTLTISGLMVEIDHKSYPVETVRVPLTQTSLIADELVWSVMHNGQRYFIMAVSNGTDTTLQFRQFTKSGNMLYKLNTKTQIEIGSNAGNNSDGKYLTPWDFNYNPDNPAQVALTTKHGINRHLKMLGETAGSAAGLHAQDSSFFTYHYVRVYTNENANEEELVKLEYGTGKWLKFNGTSLVLTATEAEADTFSWGYLEEEFNLMNNGTYPSHERVSFGYNATPTVSINTKYKAYREYSMLLGNSLTYLGHKETTRLDSLTAAVRMWKTICVVDTIRDRRTTTLSELTYGSMPDNNLVTKVTPSGASPTEIKDAGGNYIDIVDTLCVTLGLQEGAPSYRFKGDWSKYTSISDANLKIPIVRTAYHEATFDTLACKIADAELDHVFPATITPGTNDTIQFKISTLRRKGTKLLDAAGNEIAVTSTTTSYVTKITPEELPAKNVGLHLNNKDMAEVRLMDEYGNTPSWCKIKAKGDSTITVQCLSNGVRSPRSAYLYLAYIQFIDSAMKFVNYRLSVSQLSRFDYANNQQLEHSSGASGDPIGADGMQQVHENKRILYYYPEQDVELPVRERNFYGWWRWFREGNDVNGKDVSDSDIPDSVWRKAPRNYGKYSYPFRTIGDSVKVPNTATPELGDSIKVLLTMGRYTVFHYRSKDYGTKLNPPVKNPRVAPPITEFGLATKPTVTYAVDISNYYDNLPMSLKYKNQVDTACLDTMQRIPEPTLSLREVFELRPWTEMADSLDLYKTKIPDGEGAHTTKVFPLENEKYLEDHVVMAPTGNRLLLSTEQRYDFGNLMKLELSGSLLGYYMHDDNWKNAAKLGWSEARKDTMIWCGGWDADCLWYTYDPKTRKYSRCTYTVTKGDDFLEVPAKSNIDTVYYCLRARSWKTDNEDNTVEGDYMFNICRYKVIYHNPRKYGPMAERTVKGETVALLSNNEIEQKYDVLERLNFDYNEPGRAYTVYPHPLPWGDASYGYTYPETADLPHNRYHDQTSLPNFGEYGLINRIPGPSQWAGSPQSYWYEMEQHGGAEKGYMIYCDGMSSSGQVAALTLSSVLCAGQKMFLSAYVCNPSSQTGKANPNFIFSVQGKTDADGAKWEDITTYLTGDIQPSQKWNQILFPINHVRSADSEYHHFRIRIYNMSSDFDGNDFIIDDICVFATKQPLIAYQANTACKEEGETKETNVILRIDYQGIIGGTGEGDVEGYNGDSVYYTVHGVNSAGVGQFIPMLDGYLAQEEHPKDPDPAKHQVDTVCGRVYIPLKSYEPPEDSVYVNMQDLLDIFEDTYQAHKVHEADHSKPDVEIVREGYIYEVLEGESRPVKYLVHIANMNPSDTFTVHLSAEYAQMMSSMCGMTSRLKVSNRMVLELNGMEKPHTEVTGLCVNATYDVSLRVKGSLYLDSVAPIDLNGSCINDWLLYGDTAEASSKARYGYYYSDIKKVITEILRVDPGIGTNKNQFARSFSAINKNVLQYYAQGKTFKQKGISPYNMLDSLVRNGYLTLYKSNIITTVAAGDSAKYVIFPIVGTGTDALNKANVEVCPVPVVVTLKPDESESGVPLMIGGLHRTAAQMTQPVEVLATETMANEGLKIRIDSIMTKIGIKNIVLQSTNDPEFREGIHTLSFVADRPYPAEGYYTKGDSMLLTPASGSYHMQQGYSYLFHIVMQDHNGRDTVDGGCAVGRIPFVLSVQPDYLRWDPQSADSRSWNDPDNWIGITQLNVPIHEDARFAPMVGTYVVIPQVADTLPYPVVPTMPTEWKDSVQKVNFEYNNCNIIRFMPGAAMGQQQRMAYTDAVVDMSLPNQQWAFRAAPVKGMLSGDIFMSNADLNWETSPWEVGSFDAAGRTYKTGNGSFWLSVHSRTTYHYVEEYAGTETRSADGNWSKVTNGLDLYLPPAAGFAVYARTASNKDAVVRLPKSDDKYYYYGAYGETLYDRYVSGLVSERNEHAGGSGAGKLAFHADSEEYTIDNTVSGQYFVFGNPTMGYIDIWGFIDDNCLVEEFHYLDESGKASEYREVSRSAAMAKADTISEPMRYLPPLHAIMIKKSAAATSLAVTLRADRIVTDPSQKVSRSRACSGGSPAPKKRQEGEVLPQGIMTVTATNPASPRCTSHLLLGQGYHDEIRSGEDAMLTTLNIDNFTTTSTPTTPFNLYALEGNNAMSIDLRDSIVNIPVSFYMSDLEFEPTTYLWFTGVNKIHGELVFYDAQTDTERAIIDGICIAIETPTQNHERRYYIRRRGYKEHSGTEIATDVEIIEPADDEQVVKFIKNDQVYILRRGQVYTILGQPVR